MGFCRLWISGLSELTKPLTEATRNVEVEPVALGLEREWSFKTIKGVLASAPALGLPDYTKPFNLHVHECKRIASRVITQRLGPHQRLVAYYSAQLDPVTEGAPTCIKPVVAAATILEKSCSFILGHPVTIHVLHEV